MTFFELAQNRYAALIQQLGQLPDNEMSKIQTFDAFLDNLTYPSVTPVLFGEAGKIVGLQILVPPDAPPGGAFYVPVSNLR